MKTYIPWKYTKQFIFVYFHIDRFFLRYKNVDIDFHKLSVVLHNLADIYEAKADFKKLMSEVITIIFSVKQLFNYRAYP